MFTRLLCLIAFALTPWPLSANSTNLTGTAAQSAVISVLADPASVLNEKLAATHSVRARFSQIVEDSEGNLIQQTGGTLQVERPRRFRWETSAPFEQLMVSDGVRLWLYDVDLEQVTDQSLGERIANTPAMLLSGDVSAIEHAFVVSGSQQAAADVWTFELRPRDQQSPFEMMSVVFNADTLVEMRLIDNLGQHSRILFSDIERNIELDPELFRFVPPPGTDVIRQP